MMGLIQTAYWSQWCLLFFKGLIESLACANFHSKGPHTDLCPRNYQSKEVKKESEISIVEKL